MSTTFNAETAETAEKLAEEARKNRTTARIIFLVLLVAFYLSAATEHASVVNLKKARGDQSGYLWDAEMVYANRHGAQPQHFIGQRMRMPVYAAYLSLFYNPSMSDEEFFDVAKTANIWLSVLLLALLGVTFSLLLPPLISTDLTLIVAFGYFVFKAGYSQPELLFYFLFFNTFLASCYLLEWQRPVSGVFVGVLAGALAGVTHLTKAVMPLFLALFGGIYAAQEVVRLLRRRGQPDAWATFAWRAAAAATMAASFLVVVSPYIMNSKRVFGEYFYNANTTYFIWYDNGVRARAVLGPRMDEAGLVATPAVQPPNAQTYWRSHTVWQILDRLRDGIEDMIVGSYRGYGYLKYVVLYLIFAGALVAANARAFVRLLAEHAALAVFLFCYAVAYLCSTAFFSVTSNTGTIRFLLAHLAPLLFVLSWFFTLVPFKDTRWTRLGITTTHLHVLASVVIGLDLLFVLWPRLMSTYGGF